MSRSLPRALFSLVMLMTSSAAFAADGTHVELKAVPDFVERLFVPVVPEAENTFKIDAHHIDQVLSTPNGFRIDRYDGGIRIVSERNESAGYARVRAGGRELTLTLINLVPSTRVHNGMLDGYRIGQYLLAPLRGLQSYQQPKGFIKLTHANADLWVADHYRLRDFQCKLDGSQKFLVLRTEALMKLELLQHELQERHDLKFARFTIMSGYRTPYYNSMIGNETSYSRHLYGDAMDIYIDEDGDGQMDDINGDGKIDENDARFILRIAEAIDQSTQWGWLKGGAGVYHATQAHGPYLHVDARGYVARWGLVR
jgi:hypothetical protein